MQLFKIKHILLISSCFINLSSNLLAMEEGRTRSSKRKVEASLEESATPSETKKFGSKITTGDRTWFFQFMKDGNFQSKKFIPLARAALKAGEYSLSIEPGDFVTIKLGNEENAPVQIKSISLLADAVEKKGLKHPVFITVKWLYSKDNIGNLTTKNLEENQFFISNYEDTMSANAIQSLVEMTEVEPSICQYK